MPTDRDRNDGADATADDYAERVLRNEQRLIGLETLVSETRGSDNKLIEQRSESLAKELERRALALLELVTARADAVLALATEQRDADRREVVLLAEAGEKRADVTLVLLRERYDAAIEKNLEQSNDAIAALEQRVVSQANATEQMVRQWRDSDSAARELFSAEVFRRLEQLNHNNERLASFQASAVTRELWQAEKDAGIHREGVLRDQIIALDKQMLTMTPMASSDKAHNDLAARIDATVSASARVMEARVATVAEKVDELRTHDDRGAGRSAGYSSVYAAGIAAITILISVIAVVIGVMQR